jgi:ABC-2 type transport system permease protein
MVSVTGVGAKAHGGGMFGREAMAQYSAMARLRWCMFIHGLRSIHGVLDLGATGIAWLLYAVFGLSLGLGLCGAAYSMAAHSSWQYFPILFWVISILWLVLPIVVSSFQEQSDLEILLRFPVRFGSYLLLHLISGLMEASTIVGGLCCLGVWLGIVIARKDLYLWATVCLAMFAVFNILLVRAVFAWIDRWLAQRKTREILGAGFMVFMVGLLLINSVWNQRRFEGRGRTEEATPFREAMAKNAPLLKTASEAQQWLPPGLGARTLQQVTEQKTVAGLASLSMLGLWGVLAGGALAVRLKAQYRGQNLSWVSSTGKTIERGAGWTLGGSGPIAAIVEKELRSLIRSVALLWALSVPVLFSVVLAGAFHSGRSSGMNSFPYAFPLCMAYALLGFTGLFYNNLGGEGAGIQLLFLSPTPIRTVFLAKNLLHSALFALVGFAAGVLSCIRSGVPPFVVLADTGAWLVFALPCNLAAGIIFSISTPYRLNPGRITRPAGAQANTFPAVLIQSGVLGVGALVFWLCWSLKIRWLPVPILLLLAAVAFVVWMRVLHFSDDKANQHRESLIATLMKAE